MVDTVFITGTGRSGTNLLKNIFTQHNEVASLPFEQRFTVDPDGIFDFLRSSSSWSPFIADKKIARLIEFLKRLADRDKKEYEISEQIKSEFGSAKTGYPYAAWELNKWIPGFSEAIQKLERDLTAFTYEARYPGSDALVERNMMRYFGYNRALIVGALRAFLASCNEAIRKNQGCSVLVEDNTWSFLFSQEIVELVPNSLVIFMIRDPRDVISSMKKQRWTPGNVSDLTKYYADLLRAWEDQKSMIPLECYMELRFEDLIASPGQVLQSLCNRLNLDFESSMLELDISKSNIGRYKTDLMNEEINSIEQALEGIMKKYKYL